MAEDIQQQVIALIAAFNASGRLKKGVAITRKPRSTPRSTCRSAIPTR